MGVRHYAFDRIGIADLALEAFEPPANLDANPPKPQYTRAHPGQLAAQRQPFRTPLPGSHEAVGTGDLAAAAKRQRDGEVRDVIKQHGGGREHDAALLDGGKVASFQAYAIDRADLQFGHELDVAARKTRHSVPARRA